MIDIRTKRELKEIPVLDNEETYIYVMVNEENKIKIGITKNIQQRYQSLCGSNSQGIKIKHLYCSPASYLFSMETVMHSRYAKYRIPNTEWFYGDDLKFSDVVMTLHNMFKTDEYTRCNELRKSMYDKKEK